MRGLVFLRGRRRWAQLLPIDFKSGISRGVSIVFILFLIDYRYFGVSPVLLWWNTFLLGGSGSYFIWRTCRNHHDLHPCYTVCMEADTKFTAVLYLWSSMLRIAEHDEIQSFCKATLMVDFIYFVTSATVLCQNRASTYSSYILHILLQVKYTLCSVLRCYVI